MARPQNLKRQRAGDSSEEERPSKKPRSRRERRTPWNYPPGFYDNLSKVWLTRLALREVDRRNSIAPQPKPSVPAGEYSSDLARFARHGGPDLCHLRGYPEHSGAATMATQSSASSSRRTQSTKGTTPATKRISAKDKNFELHLIDHHIFPEGYEHPDGRSTPKPIDFDSIKKRISIPRASLSPSQFSESAFRDFRRQHLQAVSENDVMAKVVPTICGNTDIHSQQNIMFTELLPITTDEATKPQPDLFDGAHIHELDKAFRDDGQIRPMVIPSKHRNVPVANNFFLEVKGPEGNSAVMKRQACYDGACGARAMHSVQNYGEEEPVYDGNACSFSSAYHNGQLHLYAHHATPPAALGGSAEYHMTQIDGYTLTGKRDGFIEGATAFRNTRDLAKEHRDRFIQAANMRARGGIPPAEQDTLTSPAAVHDTALSPSDELFDCQELPESQDVYDDIPFPSFGQASDDDLAARTALPDHPNEDDQQDESQDSLSFGAADRQTNLVTSIIFPCL
ncbi:unnamed protein product [Clonostachys rosea f. rosea IK726]|uniref:Uncharacterized protein n=2 Tax=Bionectria ochroleuca TaxID=29856 RepID=A0A0B7K3K9_BIOOC|nr:unnamed protein product [Clonostachys rosea f. rosea IK726]